MLNMIKMDLYRMVRTKSMYVVWIVMAAAIFFSTSMSKLDIDTMNKEAEQQLSLIHISEPTRRS